MSNPTPTPRNPAASNTDATETQMLRTDSTMFGGYELLAEVARGGMGVVYKARHTALDRVVALKLVLSGSDASEGELSRFKVEAKAAARLDHPHIVPVYEIGKHEGQHFFSMGFVDGPSLSVRLAQGGPLPPREAAEILRKVAEAVDYAHRQGIIHRDLKPGNVLLAQTGEPLVTDFGLAKRIDSEHSLTATGQVLGTPAYMAPEQALGDHATIGPAADIYSLGATLFAALTGRPPFTATVIHELLIQVTEEPPPSLRTINPKVPAALEAICLKCLAKSPADRYSSAGELAKDLGRFLDAKQVHATRTTTARKPGLLFAVGVAVLLIAVSAGVWFGRRGPDSPPQIVAAKPDVERSESSVTSPADSAAAKLAETDAQLLRALTDAQEALLPSPTGNVWEFHYGNAVVRYEQAFREFGFTLDQGDPSQLAEILKHRSPEFRESVLCGLELWELCAVAAKQTAVIEPLRQAQDPLDALNWRRSLRLARADADEKIIQQIVREALAESPTLEQIEWLTLLIGSRSPETQPDAVVLLRDLRQRAPEGYVTNLVLASTLQTLARAKPTEKVAMASEAVAPLRAAAKARPTAALPHLQLAVVFTDLGNTGALAIERERANQLLYPEAWPHLVASQKLRLEGNYLAAIGEARQAVAQSLVPLQAHIELAAVLKLAKQDSDAEAVIQALVNLPATEEAAMKAVLTVLDTTEAVPPRISDPEPISLQESERRERAWKVVISHRSELTYLSFLRLSYEINGRSEEAVAASREAIRRAPDNAECHRLHVYNLLERNIDNAEAIASATRALNLEPNLPSTYLPMSLALAHARNGDRPQTLESLRTTTSRKYPDIWLPWHQHVAISYGIQDHAIDQLHQIVDGHWLHKTGIGLMYAVAGDDDKSTNFFQRGQREIPAKSQYWLYSLHSQLLLRGGERDLAMATAIRSIVESPETYRGWITLSQALLARGNRDDARSASAKARELLNKVTVEGRLIPVDADAEMMLVTVNGLIDLWDDNPQFRADRLKDGGARWQIQWEWSRTWATRLRFGYQGDHARLMVAAGKLAEAKELCRNLVRQRPEDANAHWAAAVVLLAEKEPKNAIDLLQKAASLDPLNGLIELDWARALIESDEMSDALPHLQKAVSMAAKGRIRGFKPVAVEAAALAMRVASDERLSQSERDACRNRALQWVRDDLAQWTARVNGFDSFDHSAAAQVLEQVLKSDHAASLRNQPTGKLPASEQAAWTTLWQEMETLLATATRKRPAADVDPFAFITDPKLDRKVAEWAIGRGGTVLILDAAKPWVELHIRNVNELPVGAFRTIGVSFSGCTDFNDADLTRLKGLFLLKEVHLDGTQVTDAGVMPLIRSLPTLGLLNLERTAITDAAIKELSGIQRLYLRGTKVSDEAAAALAKSQPRLRMLHESTLNPPTANQLAAIESSGHALDFDEWSRVDLPISLTLESGKPATLEALVTLPAALYGSNMKIVQGRYRAEINSYLGLRISPQGATVEFQKPDNSYGIIPFVQKSELPVAVPVHLAGVYDGKQHRVYVNGRLASSINDIPILAGGRLRFYLSESGGGLRGTLDEVRISSTARYTTDFSPQSRFEPDEFTLGLYHCDEGEGDILKDSSGGNHHGKIVGVARWVKAEPYRSPPVTMKPE